MAQLYGYVAAQWLDCYGSLVVGCEGSMVVGCDGSVGRVCGGSMVVDVIAQE